MQSSLLLLPLLLCAVLADDWIRHVNENIPIGGYVSSGTFTIASTSTETYLDTANMMLGTGGPSIALYRIAGDGSTRSSSSSSSYGHPFYSSSFSTSMDGLTNYLSGHLNPPPVATTIDEYGTASLTNGVDIASVYTHMPNTLLPVSTADTPHGLLIHFYDSAATTGGSVLRLLTPAATGFMTVWETSTLDFATDEFGYPVSSLDLDASKQNFFIYTMNASGELAMCKFNVATGALVWTQPTLPLLPTPTINIAGASIAPSGNAYYLLGSFWQGKADNNKRNSHEQVHRPIKTHQEIRKPTPHKQTAMETIFLAKFDQSGIVWRTSLEADIAMTVKVLSDDQYVFAIVHSFGPDSYIHRFDAVTGELLGSFVFATGSESAFMYFTAADCAMDTLVFSGMTFSDTYFSSTVPVIGSITTTTASPFLLAKISKDTIPGAHEADKCKDNHNGMDCSLMSTYPKLCGSMHNGMLLRETCPQTCGCCTVNDMCVCDQNDVVESNLGQWGYFTCLDMLQWPGVDCVGGFAASLMQQYCPCTCNIRI